MVRAWFGGAPKPKPHLRFPSACMRCPARSRDACDAVRGRHGPSRSLRPGQQGGAVCGGARPLGPPCWCAPPPAAPAKCASTPHTHRPTRTLSAHARTSWLRSPPWPPGRVAVAPRSQPSLRAPSHGEKGWLVGRCRMRNVPGPLTTSRGSDGRRRAWGRGGTSTAGAGSATRAASGTPHTPAKEQERALSSPSHASSLAGQTTCGAITAGANQQAGEWGHAGRMERHGPAGLARSVSAHRAVLLGRTGGGRQCRQRRWWRPRQQREEAGAGRRRRRGCGRAWRGWERAEHDGRQAHPVGAGEVGAKGARWVSRQCLERSDQGGQAAGGGRAHRHVHLHTRPHALDFAGRCPGPSHNVRAHRPHECVHARLAGCDFVKARTVQREGQGTSQRAIGREAGGRGRGRGRPRRRGRGQRGGERRGGRWRQQGRRQLGWLEGLDPNLVACVHVGGVAE
jgi:hypothetical protein